MSFENAGTLLDLLAALGEDDTPQPEQPSLSEQEAHELFKRRQEREANQISKFRKTFKYRPHDGAIAFQNVLMRLFGTAGVGVTVHTFFGDIEPEMIDVHVGLHETVQVPWGKVAFPIFGDEAYFRSAAYEDAELGDVYHIGFTAPKRFAPHVRGLFKEIQKELETNSIYRGKAFDGNGRFIDLQTFDPAKVVYSDDVEAQLNADLWSLIEHTPLIRQMQIPLKHAVLLAGEYGTGKTLAGLLTGQKAMLASEPWTFVQCRPGNDDYHKVMTTARMYQPCVAFFEDIDTVASTGEDDPLSKLLEMYDGATAKGSEIIAVFTTNHPERIHKAMVRPGRIDAVIQIGKQDQSSIRKLIKSSISDDQLAALDYDEIASEMVGFTPAFVKEAVHRAVRHAIVREHGKHPEVFVTSDFVLAARSLAAHQELMDAALEGERTPLLERVLNGLIERTVIEVANRTVLDPSGRGLRMRVTDEQDPDQDSEL